MTRRDRWQKRYQTEDTPWEINRPDKHLLHLVKEKMRMPCSILEIGCGTGTNAIWLAEQHFNVTGIDISATAIERAKRCMQAAGVQCEFLEADFLTTLLKMRPFQWAIDRGCFHCCETLAERQRFAEQVAAHLTDDGIWFTLTGNADDPPRDTGPPRLKATELITVVEPLFEILKLESVHFDSNRSRPPKAWFCLSRKRRR
jgi:2-polyprenyl-3-methyl-5-hydroxy-6-metoxy-1,4-benzoquinol methylase